MQYGKQGLSGGAQLTAGDVIGQVFGFQPSATNIALQSQAFNNAPWVLAGGAVLTSNNNADPRGTTAASLVNDPGAGLAELNQPIVVANNNASYVASIFVSAGTSTQMKFGVRLAGGAGIDNSIEIAPQSGVVISASPAVFNQAFVINGVTWFRLSVLITNNTSGNVTLTPYLQPASVNAAAVGNVLAFGLQVELASVAGIATTTAYIPTQNSTVTITGGYFPSFLINQNAQILNANVTAGLADNGTSFVFTNNAGNLQLNLPPVASVPDGYNLTAIAIGSRSVKLQANAAELIFTPSQNFAGVNSYSLNVTGQYSVTLVKANGQWNALTQTETHGETTLIANGNFTLPLGVSGITVSGAAGGGGGGGSAATGAGGGGGAGQSDQGSVSFQNSGLLLAMVIGTGGAGGAAGNNNGAAGTNTTIVALGYTLTGGNPGIGAAAAGGSGGGAAGGAGASGGGFGSSIGFGGNGGGNQFAAAAFQQTAGNGAAGIIYGGGGGGAGTTGGAGGNGAGGFIRIRW